MIQKRHRVFYRVYEIAPDGTEEFYAEAEGPDAYDAARLYATRINNDGTEFTSAIYHVTEVEEAL